MYKRQDRPYFRQLLPYLNISNALDTTSGNPNLKPEFIDNIELAYNIQLPKGNNIMASVYSVSYTHLDVYKRQVLSVSLAWSYRDTAKTAPPGLFE